MATAAATATALRNILKDYNFWGQSESDSPLKIYRVKGELDDAKILSRDASLRKEAQREVPNSRKISTKSLKDTFTPLVKGALSEVASAGSGMSKNGIEILEKPAEALEYYVQLYSNFKALENTRVVYIKANGDPLVGMMIIGMLGSESIYAAALLTQT